MDKINDPFEERLVKMLCEFSHTKSHHGFTCCSVEYYKAIKNLNLYNIFTQVPYTNSMGRDQFGDVVFYDRTKKINHRIECKTLKKYGNLSYTPIGILNSYDELPEDELILILYGDGFNHIVKKEVLDKARRLPYNVMVFKTIEEYREYLLTF